MSKTGYVLNHVEVFWFIQSIGSSAIYYIYIYGLASDHEFFLVRYDSVAESTIIRKHRPISV